MKMIIASKNDGKIKEIAQILGLRPSQILTYKDFADWPDVEETGATFEENAKIKARVLNERYGFAALADDSGLEVDYLGGEPGVLSARYAGAQGDDEANVTKLLAKMKGAHSQERTARFKCAAVLKLPKDKEYTALGNCEGRIAEEPKGDGGFGYDPVFIPAGHTQTMAELSCEIKNALSHRGQAFRQIKELMEQF